MPLSYKDQQLLILMFNKEYIQKKKQKIFKSKFYNSISRLKRLKLIESSKHGRIKTYRLTKIGKFFCVILLEKEEEVKYILVV